MFKTRELRNVFKKSIAFFLMFVMIFGTLLTNTASSALAADEISSFSTANVMTPSREMAFARKVSTATGSAVTVDGLLNEGVWNTLPYTVNQMTEATIPNNTCSFGVVWSPTHLSIGIDVYDQVIITDFLDPGIYNNDSIEIFIDGTNSKRASGYDLNTYHIYIQFDGKLLVQGKGSLWNEAVLEGLEYAVVLKEDGTGYTMEVSIPFASIGVDPKETSVIGLEVSNNDNDSNNAIERRTLKWNKDMAYNQPVTWGMVYLYEHKEAVVSTTGTPALDGTLDLSQWKLNQSIPVQKYNGATVSFGSLSDYNNLYVGLKVDDPNLSFNTINVENDVAYPPVVDFIIDGDYSLTGARNAYDVIMQWQPVAQTVAFHTASPFKSSIKQKQIKTDSGYFLIAAIPWSVLTPATEGIDYIQRANYSFAGFDIMAGQSNSANSWYKTQWWTWWGTTAVTGIGKLFINNPNLAVPLNNAPTGTPYYTYSIKQGTSLSGTIKVTDKDNDTLTFSLVADLPEGQGVVVVDPATGAWTYSTPNTEFVKPDYRTVDPLYTRSFDPTGVNFFIKADDGNGGTFITRNEIRVGYTPTNLTYYVDGDNGNDANDGLSKENALKTIMAAHDKTKPGDTVIIHESTIPYGWNEIENFQHDGPFIITISGLPDAYITYKAAEGENPVLKSNGEWNTMKIQASYVIMDGLTIEGLADELTYEQAYAAYHSKNVPSDHPDFNPSWGRSISLTNTNGIDMGPVAPHTIDRLQDGIRNPNFFVPHHIVIRNCTVNKLAGGGVGGGMVDYITVENNTITNNGWWDMWATSGVSFLGTVDIDNNTNDYKFIIRNNHVAGNRHFIPWLGRGLSDGNGIIIDCTKSTYPEFPYIGKILITNNLVYENGGSGIHAYKGDYVDVINNTSVNNNSTPALNWGEIFVNQADYFTMFNNIAYSRTGFRSSPSGAGNKGVVYDHNIFFNYSSSSTLGQQFVGTVVGTNNLYPVDPKFTQFVPVVHDVNTAVYPATWTTAMINNAKSAGYVPNGNYDVNTYGYDFTLQEDSPAFGSADTFWSDKVGNTTKVIGVFAKVGVDNDLVDPVDPTPTPTPEPVSFTKDELKQITVNGVMAGKVTHNTLYAGGTKDLSLTLKTEFPQVIQDKVNKGEVDVKIFYETSNASVASVSENGLVTAQKEGRANVVTTVTIGNEVLKFTIKVTVKKAEIKITKDKNKIFVGDNVMFECEVFGFNEKDITWMTTQKEIAEVGINQGKTSAIVSGITAGIDYVVARVIDADGKYVRAISEIEVRERKEKNK